MAIQTVHIKDEYITLGQLLKLTDCIQSGGEAKAFLSVASILVNGEKENRRGKKLYPGDEIKVKDKGVFKVAHK